jgi:hypothetical protein
MSLKTVLASLIVAAAALVGAQGAFADGFASLQPGVPAAGLDESVKVNVVLSG